MDERIRKMSAKDAVQHLANVFDEYEGHARDFKAEARSSRKAIEAIRSAGHIGFLEAQEAAGELDALATTFERDLYALHRKWTLRAQELGIDLPATRSGDR